MNSLSNVLVKSGHDIYENIINVVLISIMWFILISPAIFLFTPYIAPFYLILTAVPSFAGVMYALKQRIDRKPFKYSMFFTGIKKFYFRAFLYSILLFFFVMIPVSSWWYYFKVRTIFAFIIAVIQTYLFLFIILSQIYFLPCLINEDKKMIVTINTSVKLFLDNGLYTVGSLVQIITVSALLLITIVSVPLLFAGMLSIFLLNLYNNLLLKYKDNNEE
ncbi:hypothetical protein [Thermoanaerobacterium sp. RBIITD]|uniref:hypothetical protein n=1 Tax=Thermoanaerobacterium sp. RBIITD TaxID=1550240 RepID=UPI000BB69DAC|nr:hypothetical protein [Thermoanaerobacterium sp. RBIITD]SNX53314.1 hypothetical protein SAMN05660242_0837 [Thermoanaerobacterium sp. RBIITD]